jgi:amino acid transporter
VASVLKRLLVGRPLASESESHQRLLKVFALAIFASDAISSTAYATEEILHVLVPIAAEEALEYLIPISLVVMVLMAIVVTSYRQVIYAYPSGGGSYQVSQDNLGETPALVAGASLMVDYTLTVAVSISAGTAAITSAFPELRDQRVYLCLGFILVLMVANLRGLKESATVFAIPTYVYVVTLALLIGYGLYRVYFGDLDALPPVEERYEEFTKGGTLLTGVTLYALMRAFSSGAVALTGVEAISNGVPAFRKPEPRNASTTLIWMGVILATAFFGISLLAHELQPTLSDDETVLSIIATAVFGDGAFLYFVFQAATAGILLLAANTAFAGFPQIASILARDGYLPRQLHNRGDRLVFSNGIIALAVIAGLLIVAFGGVTTALIPLYAVGVFCGFTLAQTGMCIRHRRLRHPGWQRGFAINLVGAITTGLVLLVVVVSKFTIGAWIPVVVIPIIAFILTRVKHHYSRVQRALALGESYRSRRHTHTVVVLVGSLNRATMAALSYARSLAPDRLVALSVVLEDGDAEHLQEQWERFDVPVTLQIISSPYRELTTPVVRFLDELDEENENDVITVVLPEFVLTHWWEQLLHNQSALLLKGRLLFRRNTVVVSVPYHIEGGDVALPALMEAPAAAGGTEPGA